MDVSTLTAAAARAYDFAAANPTLVAAIAAVGVRLLMRRVPAAAKLLHLLPDVVGFAKALDEVAPSPKLDRAVELLEQIAKQTAAPQVVNIAQQLKPADPDAAAKAFAQDVAPPAAASTPKPVP